MNIGLNSSGYNPYSAYSGAPVFDATMPVSSPPSRFPGSYGPVADKAFDATMPVSSPSRDIPSYFTPSDSISIGGCDHDCGLMPSPWKLGRNLGNWAQPLPFNGANGDITFNPAPAPARGPVGGFAQPSGWVGGNGTHTPGRKGDMEIFPTVVDGPINGRTGYEEGQVLF